MNYDKPTLTNDNWEPDLREMKAKKVTDKSPTEIALQDESWFDRTGFKIRRFGKKALHFYWNHNKKINSGVLALAGGAGLQLNGVIMFMEILNYADWIVGGLILAFAIYQFFTKNKVSKAVKQALGLIYEAKQKDSDGGKQITAQEWRKIADQVLKILKNVVK